MSEPYDTPESWRDEVERLLAQIEAWAGEQGWLVVRTPRTIDDDGSFPPYELDVLTIESNRGRLRVEPVGRWVVNALGRLDIYAWPSMHRFLLVRRDDAWEVRTDSGVRWPHPWTRQTFVELARALVDAA